jgi:hypothetical protein
MLNIRDLKAAYEKAIGHPTSNSTVYNLLDRPRLAQADAPPLSRRSEYPGAD